MIQESEDIYWHCRNMIDICQKDMVENVHDSRKQKRYQSVPEDPEFLGLLNKGRTNQYQENTYYRHNKYIPDWRINAIVQHIRSQTHMVYLLDTL